MRLRSAAALAFSFALTLGAFASASAHEDLNGPWPRETRATGWEPSVSVLRLLLSREQPAELPQSPALESERARAAIAAFYAQRAFVPAWSKNGTANRQALEVVERLAAADADGLDPRRYALPADIIQYTADKDARRTAQFEILMSGAVLAYAEDAQAGRIEPATLSRLITAQPERPDPIEALTRVAAAKDPAAELDAFNPPHEGFRRLRSALAELRAASRESADAVLVPEGKALREGMRDQRVTLLRQRLDVPATEAETDDLFDPGLTAAVRAFQERNGLHSDGVVGPRTLLALNAPNSADSENIIIANMERWRWLPRDMGTFHIMVNVPEFMARVVADGETSHETRVVVGKRENQTPIFSDLMDHIVVNPYWNVPYSIATKEMLPSIRANPASYFSRRGYEVVARGRVVDPRTIDWSGVNMRSLRIRQRPGAANALGRIKFMFPNEHSVYLHDTPSKALFSRSDRAFSHGCVRVENPFAFADAVLQQEDGWNAKRLEALVGGRERRVNLTKPIPIHITYFTAFVDDRGQLQRRPDLYGHDRRLMSSLGLSAQQKMPRP